VDACPAPRHATATAGSNKTHEKKEDFFPFSLGGRGLQRIYRPPRIFPSCEREGIFLLGKPSAEFRL